MQRITATTMVALALLPTSASALSIEKAMAMVSESNAAFTQQLHECRRFIRDPTEKNFVLLRTASMVALGRADTVDKNVPPISRDEERLRSLPKEQLGDFSFKIQKWMKLSEDTTACLRDADRLKKSGKMTD